ncbi:hypothetical protein A1Q1_01776 [Trichosporon asahii var. asahii CBS 2479]|uniref:Aminoglycoside phosphotransferase domain-containing protein n=1 Tax=Trichosporon asahii var. asahii (strain ATCC 90039 / CBS 2479 / JCM 2466 / KCTC 7840 / NBRC 103889/ NCYC 2677 / UAMH 7654) TaxID=1186058 RepID=J6F1T5_TRIAS|nr:hypothetical protein A1Q1_01776 [Trichosporon asahii var. asahii CBS 2479]EJT49127.1 hypothetical protein A1Q1_01776 [Trichosporon asahii var. asahii CBS 2479]
MSDEPTSDVLNAFGLTGPLRLMEGGREPVYATSDDSAVLKRAKEDCQRFVGEVLDPLPQNGFRLARALRPKAGGWTCDGWGANELLPGKPREKLSTEDVVRVLKAGQVLHAATEGVKRELVPVEDHAWARADAAVWGEGEVAVPEPWKALVNALVDFTRDEPDLGPSQLIHGDLSGNVLFAPVSDSSPSSSGSGPRSAAKHSGKTPGWSKQQQPDPGIIDFSPYFRPAAYALGIVIADALLWHGHGSELRGTVQRAGISVPVGAIARGLLFRIYTAIGLRREGVEEESEKEEVERFTMAAKAMGLGYSYTL